MPSSDLPSLTQLPRRSSRNVAVHADRSGARQLRLGHPWLFESGVLRASEGATGDLAVVFDRDRQFVAAGLYDPGSNIRVRVLQARSQARIDAEFFEQRFSELAQKRAHLLATGTDGYRLVHGENERLPGLAVDRYADTLVLKLYTPAWIPQLAEAVPALLRVQPAERVVLRLSRDTARRAEDLYGLYDGQLLVGELPTEPLIFHERGLRFECDPVNGQKTGFFLDQRDNRARVEQRARGCSVLNVCSYTGGFTVAAARGGATHVASLDQSGTALDAVERNLELNSGYPQVAAMRRERLEGDAFEVLAKLAHSGRQFDFVIVDPPAFAQQQAQVDSAKAAYRRLLQPAFRVTAPGGSVALASCSARVTAEDFFAICSQAARHAGRRIEKLEKTGHASDHPISFAHGAYLKCLFARVP